MDSKSCPWLSVDCCMVWTKPPSPTVISEIWLAVVATLDTVRSSPAVSITNRCVGSPLPACDNAAALLCAGLFVAVCDVAGPVADADPVAILGELAADVDALEKTP